MAEDKEGGFVKTMENFVIQKHRLILIVVLAFALIIRLKYMTINAAVWWDEADYLSLAKHFGLGLPEQAAPWRARGISMIWGVFYWLGANEWVIRLIGTLVAVAGVYLTYLAGKALCNKQVGLIAAAMLAVYNEYLFWGARISMDVYALTLWALIAYLFWKAYTENKTWHYVAVGALYGFSIYAYDSIGFIALFFAVFLLVTEKFRFLKNPKIWYMVIAAIIMALPFAAYNYVEFGNFFGDNTNIVYKIYPRFGRFATGDFSTAENTVQDWQRPAGSIISDFFTYFTAMPLILKIPFFIALLAGIPLFFEVIIGLDLIGKQGEHMELKKRFYLLLWVLTVLIAMGLLIALTGYIFEPRLIFPAMPALFIIAGYGLITIYKLVAKYNKEIAVIAVIGLFIVGAYMQLSYANALINSKKDSFVHQKMAGEWIKEHTNPGETFMLGCGLSVNFIYYSERQIAYVSNNQTLVNEAIAKGNRYYIIDGYDPACASENIKGPPEGFVPVQAFFIDEAKTQPIIIIYEFAKA